MKSNELLSLWVLASLAPAVAAEAPHPVDNPQSPLALRGDWLPADHHRIDYSRLPQVPVEHVVVNDVRAGGGVNQHNYLIRHRDRFWVMWSDGPGVEDRVGQVVKYSTSRDGVTWETPQMLTPFPPNSGPESPHYNTRSKAGLRYIARGFWVRHEELLALASLDESAGFFGPSLALHAFRWQEEIRQWQPAGLVQSDAINNFPPEKLPSGEWAMSRRRHDYKTAGVDFLVGGVKVIDQWHSFPVVVQKDSPLAAEEPLWWTLPEGHLVSWFRDNRRSGYLYRSFSTDQGRTWSSPVRTDFPDATSKLHGLRLSDGRYALVSNSNPRRRDPLTLALSDDGLVFDRLFYLVGGRHVDYPHAIEHDGYLLIAHSGGKQSVEIERVRISVLGGLSMPAQPIETPH
jgi:hypothetical protein